MVYWLCLSFGWMVLLSLYIWQIVLAQKVKDHHCCAEQNNDGVWVATVCQDGTGAAAIDVTKEFAVLNIVGLVICVLEMTANFCHVMLQFMPSFTLHVVSFIGFYAYLITLSIFTFRKQGHICGKNLEYTALDYEFTWYRLWHF